MRGKPRQCVIPIAHRRIIPAHAGQTKSSTNACRNSSDHPRACGANALIRLLRRPLAGSSPRMRGKLTHLLGLAYRRRIIPAHAGQTDGRGYPRRFSTDHPRACGANMWCAVFGIRFTGSSPRMRGKLFHVGFPCEQHRIIPAHAGQTYFRGERWQWDADHPRACGANRGAMYA